MNKIKIQVWKCKRLYVAILDEDHEGDRELFISLNFPGTSQYLVSCNLIVFGRSIGCFKSIVAHWPSLKQS